MIENVNEKLWLKLPIDYYGICTLYPLTIKDYLYYNDVQEGDAAHPSYADMFTPFIMNHAFLKDAGIDYTGNMWDFYFLDSTILATLMWSLTVLTRKDDIRVVIEEKRLYFDETHYLGAENYKELFEIILQAHCFEPYKHKEQHKPKFKDEATRLRYEKYLAARAKNKNTNKSELSLLNCIQYIQLRSTSYIPEDEILTWSYWKLMHWYNKVALKTSHDELHACFAHWGGKEVKRSLDTLKKDIMTKI